MYPLTGPQLKIHGQKDLLTTIAVKSHYDSLFKDLRPNFPGKYLMFIVQPSVSKLKRTYNLLYVSTKQHPRLPIRVTKNIPWMSKILSLQRCETSRRNVESQVNH